MSHDDEMNVQAYFEKIPKLQDDDMGYTEYILAAYDLSSIKRWRKMSLYNYQSL